MTNTRLRSPLSHRGTNAARRVIAAVAGGDRELPTYFIVGAKRAGTTSVNEYLVQHPDVERGLVEKGSRYFDVNFDRGWKWFVRNCPDRRRFDRAERRTGRRPILGESSPYYCFHPDAPARIADRFPEARLIFVLREPVGRAWSHYNYELKLGFEDLDIHAALDAEERRLTTGTSAERSHAHRHFTYLSRSLYADQVERIYRHFDPEQLLVVESEALFRQPTETMADVYRHVGLAPFAGDYATAFKQNHYDAVPNDVVARLVPLLEPSNERLRELFGDRLSWTTQSS